MLSIVFQAKTTAAVLALAAHFFVAQRTLGDIANADCLPAALDAALRAVGHHIDTATPARVRSDGTIAPGVTPEVAEIDRRAGDTVAGELERLRLELTGGGGLSSGVAFGPSGLVRNNNGHEHGTSPAGVPGALAAEGLRGRALTANAQSVVRALTQGKRAVVMGGSVGKGAWTSCHATTAVGIDPVTRDVVIIDPESGASERSVSELSSYFSPAAGNRTIFGCPSFAYEVDA